MREYIDIRGAWPVYIMTGGGEQGMGVVALELQGAPRGISVESARIWTKVTL